MSSNNLSRSPQQRSILGRIASNPRLAAPLAAVGINVLLGVTSCLGYHVMTGQTFSVDPKCAAVYLYTSLGAISVGLVGIKHYDAIPGRTPIRKTLFLAGVSWVIFVAVTFLPVSSSLARRGVARTTMYYGVAALAAMGVLVYVRERLTN